MDKVRKIFIILIVFIFFIGSCFLLWVSNNYVVPIMMYHNVDNTHYSEGNWITPENFERHMIYLKEHGYNVISLDELVTAIKEKQHISRKTVVITFDDGFENNYTNAYPILKQYGFPATMFIPSDLVNTKGRLTWEEIKEMAKHGVDIGSHGRVGEYLPSFSKKRQRDEIFTSKRILEDKLGRKISYFAYPIGGFTQDIKKMLVSAGYKGACTTNRGFDKKNLDVFELNRIKFSNKDNSDIILWAKLSGYYNLFRGYRAPF